MVRAVIVCLFFLWATFAFAGNKPSEKEVDALLSKASSLQRNNVDSCYVLAREALMLAKENNYQKGITTAYNQLSAAMMIRGKLDSSIYFCKQALAVSTENALYHASSYSYVLLSYIYYDKGNQDSVMFAIQQALHYSQLTNDSTMLPRIYVALGGFNMAYKAYNKALQNYELGYALSIKQKKWSNAGDALVGMASVYYFKDDIKQALHYYLQVDSLSRLINEPTGTAQNQNNIALCYAALGNKTQALYYYWQALGTYKKHGMRSEEANAYYNMGELYAQFSQPDSAIYFANLSLRLARQINALPKIAQCYKLLANAYSLQKDFVQAYSNQEKYTLLNDSLLDLEKVRSISEMQTKYETELKEKQIAILNQQAITKAAQRNLFIAANAVLFLALLSLAIFYIQKQRIAKRNQLIAKQEIDTLLSTQELKSFNAMMEGQEEERNRIATDLHDRLGSMLATVKLLFSGLETKLDTTSPDYNKHYQKATHLLDDACVEVRRISHNMSSGLLMSFGVDAALKELAESIESSGLLTCKVLHYGVYERMDHQTEIGIYRMVQEMVGNMLKHAKATEIIIQLNQTTEAVNVTVEDNGIGFDLETKRKSGGMGLKNLEARATSLNGTLHIETAPGKGTIFMLDIPLKNEV